MRTVGNELDSTSSSEDLAEATYQGAAKRVKQSQGGTCLLFSANPLTHECFDQGASTSRTHTKNSASIGWSKETIKSTRTLTVKQGTAPMKCMHPLLPATYFAINSQRPHSAGVSWASEGTSLTMAVPLLLQ